MDDATRAELKRCYPEHYFVRVVKGNDERILAIPKVHAGKPVPSMPGLTVDMLHGATIHLRPNNKADAAP